MGTYYAYANHTRKEIVDVGRLDPAIARSPDGARDPVARGDDKDHAVVLRGGALAYLLLPAADGRGVTGYRGRWGGRIHRVAWNARGDGDDGVDEVDWPATLRDAQVVAVVADSDVDLGPGGELSSYRDVTEELIAEMANAGFLIGGLGRGGSACERDDDEDEDDGHDEDGEDDGEDGAATSGTPTVLSRGVDWTILLVVVMGCVGLVTKTGDLAWWVAHWSGASEVASRLTRDATCVVMICVLATTFSLLPRGALARRRERDD
jgi:hypothetical protein